MRLIRSLVDRFLPRGALVLAVLSLGYFAMGLVRNKVFAGTYGAGAELDAYNAAFRIPEIALDLLVASGLSAPFVPIFSRLRDEGEERANTFGRTVVTVAVAVMAVTLGVLFVFAPAIADSVWTGFDRPTRDLYIELFRINCFAQILFTASIAIGEILVANRRFVFYALAPIFYTGGIVLGTVLLGRSMGINGTAVGALVGAGAHLGIRAIGLRSTSFRYRPSLAVRTPAFREFIRLMLPRMISYPIDPVIVFYFSVLALSLGPGQVSAISFALDYQFVPVSLIAVSFSLAVFPSLSAAYAAGDGRTFRALVRRNVATIGLLTLAAAIALFVTARLLVSVFLGGGRFGPEAVALTSSTLAAFALSIPFDSLSYPLSRALYATHNTILQVVASMAALGTIVVVASALVGSLGIVAIPLAYAAGSALKVVLLTMFLVPRMRRIGSADQPPAPPPEPATEPTPAG